VRKLSRVSCHGRLLPVAPFTKQLPRHWRQIQSCYSRVWAGEPSLEDRRNKIRRPLLWLLAVGIVASLIFPVYIIRQGAGQTLLWNKDEAYLFIDTTTFGYQLMGAQYLIEVVKETLGLVRPSDHRRSSLIIFHIIPGNIRRYVANDLYLHPYLPIAGNIYANRQGTVMKWSGQEFTPVGPNEQVRLFELVFNKTPREFNDLDGWSKREGLSGFDAEDKYDLEVGGRTITLVVTTTHVADKLSIDLIEPGRASHQVYYLDQRPHWVSSAEYSHLLFE
jgi:hypothetical protein